MNPGDTIWVRVSKTDGSFHRWWQARVESVSDDCIVTYTWFENPVHHNAERFPQAVYLQPWDIRSYYWPGRRHTLLEVYRPTGELFELYADITSPIEIGDGQISFIDHELDVYQSAGEAPEIVDQDEFAEAAEVYGYTDEFMRQCYELAEALLDVLANWQPLGPAPRPC